MGSSTVKKNAKGYGYKYTDIAEINSALEDMGIRYYQYIERIDNDDYIYTVPVIDGKEQSPRRGCKVVVAPFDKKSNPAQEQGSGITYARRYSLLMAFGLATADDDAQCMTREKTDKKEAFPPRQIMVDVVKNKFPEGSDKYNKLIAWSNVTSIEEMTDDQLKVAYSRSGEK